MKHIEVLTKQRPSIADAREELICNTNAFILDVLSAKGATSPLKEVLDDKCDPTIQ